MAVTCAVTSTMLCVVMECRGLGEGVRWVGGMDENLGRGGRGGREGGRDRKGGLECTAGTGTI